VAVAVGSGRVGGGRLRPAVARRSVAAAGRGRRCGAVRWLGSAVVGPGVGSGRWSVSPNLSRDAIGSPTGYRKFSS